MDYKKIGFKAGLEIHQQLATGKLFCACPAYLRKDAPHFRVKRTLHAVAGEQGGVDAAAAHEAAQEREFVYEGYTDSTCLVELDESPPHLVNREALEEALRVALLLHCEIYPVTQIMRKIVIDGSNPSGFQRTMLFAHDGYIETSLGRVRIDTVMLEEDAARIIERNGDTSIYRLDRLGTPLIEIATAPDLQSAEHIKEAALALGDILRACKVKRGIGTIRQDVNISITGHGKVEIKGFQDPAMMITTVHSEIQRQLQLLELQKKLQNKRFSAHEVHEVSEFFKKTSSPFVQTGFKEGKRVFGVRMPGWAGLLGIELQLNRRVGTEFSEYARLFGVGGIMHSDEPFEEKYTISEEELQKVRTKLGATKNDAFLLTVAHAESGPRALEAVIARARMFSRDFLIGEVRNARPDGTSSFLRPVPGSARMYPETDLPLVRLSRTLIDGVKKSLPKLRAALRDELKQKGLHEELIALVLEDRTLFDEVITLSQVYNGDLNLIAKMVTLWRSEFATKLKMDFDELRNTRLSEAVLEKVLAALQEKKVQESDVKPILSAIASGKDVESALVVDKKSDDELEEYVQKLVREKPGLRANAYMGLVLQHFGKSADARKVMELLTKIVEKK